MRRLRPAWYDDILCRDKGELFFSERAEDIAAAKALCAQCPAREPCSKAVTESDEGIWAGMTEKERQIASGKRAKSSPLTDGSMARRKARSL